MSSPYPGLGFDPAPGDPRAVDGVSARCRTASRALDADAAVDDAVRSCTEWSGQGSDAFAARLGRIPARLRASREVLDAMAEILDGWSSTLLGNQRRADDLDRTARGLTRQVTDATDDVERAATDAQFATGAAAAELLAGRDAAQHRLDDLQVELQRVRDEARVLERDHRAEAERVAERLRLLRSDGVEAARGVPDRRALFGGIARGLTEQSTLGSGMAALLVGRRRGTPTPVQPGPAAAAFAQAVAGTDG